VKAVYPQGAVPPGNPVILVLIGHYLPGYKAGGPIRSVANMVEALGDEFDFRIVTSDRDLRGAGPYDEIEPAKWIQVGKARVLYLPAGPRWLWRFVRMLFTTQADVLYLNGFLARRFSMLPVILRRLWLFRPNSVVLAPRGEFSLGALRLKAWRKHTYITLSRWAGMYEGVLWHASSLYEEQDIRRAFRRSEDITVAWPIAAGASADVSNRLQIVTAPDIPRLSGPSAFGRRKVKPAGSIVFAFLSRISRMKNLDGALNLLSGLSGDVQFRIYGPTEDLGYWQACQKIAARLPANIRVEYCGEVHHDNVAAVLSDCDALLFPTHGENYGHVILEALLAGCPVVISDQTPWRNLESKGIGWDLPLNDPARFRRALQDCIDMPPEGFSEWSHRARQFGLQQLDDAAVLDQNRRLFANRSVTAAEPAVGAARS